MTALHRYLHQPSASVRLFCFPHAGGAASTFRTWPASFPPHIEVLPVQYPGREERLGEELQPSMDALVGELVGDVVAAADRPFAFFGHSMGAAIAYELTLALRARGLPQPSHLFASALPAPPLAGTGGVHLRDDDGICAEVAKLGGTAEALDHPELRELFVPVLRNDYRLIETYRASQAEALDCPVTMLRGTDDAAVSDQEALAWQHTTRSFELLEFEGDHFYLVPQRDAVIDVLVCRLVSTG